MSNQLAVFEQQGGIVSMAIDSLTEQVLRNADDGVEPTLEQIQIVISMQKAATGFDRGAVYWHRQKRTFTKLGYATFEDFGLDVLKYEKVYLHRLANAHSVEVGLKLPIGNSPPETHLRPLSPIPENERAAIWEEANRKAEEAGKERTAKMVQEAVNEWKSKNESLQNDLVGKTQALESAEAKVRFQKMTIDSTEQQNTELRNRDQALIDARVAEAKAQLILENQQAIAEAKRQAENSAHELERLKREQAKAIADGVRSELNTFDAQITHKEHVLSGIQSKIDALREVENSLEREVGHLQTHKKCIAKIKDNLSFLTVSFSDAFDTGAIPDESFDDWIAIYNALGKITNEMGAWIDDNSPVTKAIEGVLVV